MDGPSHVLPLGNGISADLEAEVLRDAEGRPIPLRPRSFAVLRHLVLNPGRLVTKDELFSAVWPDLAVTDDSLVQCIGDIRRALGDTAHAVVRTVPRRGYRFVLPGTADPPARRRTRRVATTAAAAALALLLAAVVWTFTGREPDTIPLVAVLPFESIGGQEAERRLADGLTEDIVTDLARFPEFGVLARNATKAFAGAPTDLRRLADELQARFAVTGTILESDGHIRVTAQLVETAGATPLWSARWDRPAEDVFAIQTEIAEQIANRLGGGAGLVQEAGRIAAHRKPPASLSAYEHYLIGTEKLERITVPDVEAAIVDLNRAVALDPGFARAWVELFHSHCVLASFGVEPERNYAIAFAAAERALALDPADPEAHAVFGMSQGMRGDFVRGEAAMDRAIAMAPNAAEILTFYSAMGAAFGKPDKGAEMADRAIALDPQFPMWASRLYASAYFMAGRYRDALDMFDRVTSENYGRLEWAMRTSAHAALGETAEARHWLEAALAAVPDLTVESIAARPDLGEIERARLTETMRLAGFPPCEHAVDGACAAPTD
jgi:TolB-like protein/DNA-binding winged helix-turn-helix (wHTH) protein/tetratricopeptide (TPR) repeat protein